MEAMNMDDLTFDISWNMNPWNMPCSMFNAKCSMFNEPLLPPVGGRPGWGLNRNSQSYNRYSYCLNNPLKYVDPSGYGYKPDDWDGKVDISPAYWIFFGGANQNHYVPGSGNHWSDSQRGEYGNFMLISGQTFVNYYGQDAYDNVFNNVVNPQNNTNSIEPFNGAVYYLSLDNGDWTYVAFVDAEGNRVNLVESLEGAGNSINYFYLPLENGVDANSQADVSFGDAATLAAVALATGWNVAFGEPTFWGEVAMGAATLSYAIYIYLNNTSSYPKPWFTERPNNYIPGPLNGFDNKNYFPQGNGNDLIKWTIRLGGASVLGKKLYDGFNYQPHIMPADNTNVIYPPPPPPPFYTPIPNPNWP